MDPIEKAIRSAFEKGDAEDKAFREGVYRRAFAALDRALQANPGLTVEAAINRRKLLQAKIVEIETEFIPAVAPSQADIADPLAGAFELRMEPGAAPPITVSEATADQGLAAGPRPGSLDDLDVRRESDAARAPSGSHRERLVAAETRAAPVRIRRRRPYAIVFIVASLAALLGMGILFAYQTGLFMSAEERDTSVPNPPPNTADEDFIPENEDPPILSSEPESQRDWIGIFTPADATSVSAPTGTTAEAMQDDTGRFLRIRSGSAGEAIVFDIGQGVLEQISGKKATFDIVARAAEGKETEMAVDCNFAELGDCGRKRYALGYEKADFLFELSLPSEQPGAGGTVAINSDFANQGKAVDIYEIKVSVSP